MEDSVEIVRIGFPAPGPHGTATPVTAFAFDTSQELLWTGNTQGRITSFYGSDLSRYTAYRAHTPQEGPVRQLLLCDKGVLSVGTRSVHFAIRRGLTQWHTTNENFQDLRCLCFVAKGTSEVLVAGCQGWMFKVNVDNGEIIETLPSPDHYTQMKRGGGQYICAATSTGSVQLLDSKSLEVLKTWKAHMGWINDLDANSSFLVTCGWSPRQQYGNMLDPLAKVFDLKSLLPLPPVPFHSGAAFVRLHPRMLTTGVIASQTGQLQVVDLLNSSMINLRQINLIDSYLVGLELAPSGEALALADSMCAVHLWGNPRKVHFTDYSNPTEFPNEAPLSAPSLDWSPHTPLSSIGMPYYRETLLSAWLSPSVFEVGAPPKKIDPTVLAALTRAELGAYAPNPRKTRRNQYENTRNSEKAIASIETPRFLSEQAKDSNGEDSGRRMSEVLDAMTAASLEGNINIEVPIMYRNVEIKYSKFGIEDFDFEYYNRTEYSGLETHIANSYVNPLLQILKFTPCIRNLALHHAASPCLSETCILCELAFVTDMLEKARGQNCQATNFLRTFSSLSHAASLGLLEEDSSVRPLTLMLQATNRFLMEKITVDFKRMSPSASHMDHALTTVAMSTISCTHCSNVTVRPGGTYVHDLVYPPPTKNQSRIQGPTFSQVLKASVERLDQQRGWCDKCQRYQKLTTRKTIRSIPPVLSINAAVHSSEAKQVWAKPNWLPQEIGIIVEQGQFFCYEGQDLKIHLQRGVYRIAVYELVGVVADINSGSNQKSHLVSMINVSPSLREQTSEDSWHLFNDFLVRKVPFEEAIRFDPTWKVPSMLTYQIKSARHMIDDSWKENLDTSLLYRRWPAQNHDDPTTFQPLDFDTEKPKPGTPVGIDAEFVALQQEELEIKADGSHSTLRPKRLALARVSVLRGGETDAGAQNFEHEQGRDDSSQRAPPSHHFAPFVDDYISINEPIVDYLTEFSGISATDLDPKTSPHSSSGRLVPLKIAYKKVWILLNLGCVFCGHGLQSDFRILNIHIPKFQVIDTVELYYLKSRGRKLSLRFLSWLLLNEEIQGGMHDSVEDARTALKLWRRWQEFEAEGTVEEMLTDVYRRGREYGYKVPSQGGAATGHAARLAAAAGGSVVAFTDSGRTTPIVGIEGDLDAERSLPGTPRGKVAGLVVPRSWESPNQ